MNVTNSLIGDIILKGYGDTNFVECGIVILEINLERNKLNGVYFRIPRFIFKMNWKERYTELKVGDKVRIINRGCNKPDNMCDCNQFLNKIGTVCNICKNKISVDAFEDLSGSWCSGFLRDSMVKVQ